MEPAEVQRNALALSDALHRALAGDTDERCWLMLDPAARPLDPEREFDALLLERSPIQVRAPGDDPDPRLMPQLVELDGGRAADSNIIRLALEEGLAECEPESLAQGAGRRICGWLKTRATGSALAAHIARQLIQRRPDRQKVLLRWIDPAGLWALWPLLEPAQRKNLLGPVDAYWLLDPAGYWLTLRPPPGAPVVAALDLTPAQWSDFDAVGALNLALREWHASRAAPQQLITARQTVMAALRRAKVLGFADDRDLAAFAGRALTVHPRFDLHPFVQERLAKREDDDYFTALVDDLTPEDWRRVRTEGDRQTTTR